MIEEFEEYDLQRQHRPLVEQVMGVELTEVEVAALFGEFATFVAQLTAYQEKKLATTTLYVLNDADGNLYKRTPNGTIRRWLPAEQDWESIRVGLFYADGRDRTWSIRNRNL